MDRAKVIKVDENGYAYLIMELSTSCNGCANKAVCCSGSGNNEPQPVKIKNSYDLREGDQVSLEFSSKDKLLLSFIIFILPIILLIIGYSVAIQIFKSETAGIIGALIGLFDGLLFLMIYGYIKKRYSDLKPEHLEIIQRNNQHAQ